jgi:capsular polysaccharide biosynthesis protein
MEETLGIIDFLNTLKKRWKLIFLITLAAALISSSITYFVMTPVYQATTQILVNQKNEQNQIDLNQLRNNVDLINTYSEIIKSPVILEKVINKLSLTQSVEQLKQRITINSQENNQIFYIVVEDPNAGKAVEMANTMAETFQKEIPGIMSIDNVKILASAEIKENPTPVNPKPFLNISVAIIVGLMLGIGLAFLLKIADKTLKDEDEVAALLGLPVLGSIQNMTKDQKKGLKNSKIKQMGSETIVSYSKE